ncbi:EF-hand [Choiromyces venosus 120613-1]|uniref:EF-hand n=1 Tax=Choiromyces venosus 120613-1 TaxID=1336337 RepID=A0A3N4JD28_9PEZI|nr:EF-hand [Choiromyces venosus 120613-1]
MAYYNSNPDALPAHAEPEQAAQMMSGGGYDNRPSPNRPSPAGANYGDGAKPKSPRPDPYRQQQGGFPQGQQGHNQPPRQQYQSPPPGQFGGPPPGQFGQRSPPVSRPPPTPAPPQGVDPTLFPLFKAVDKDGSGQLSEKELRAALVNGDWTSFDPHTVRMMIRMFDTDRSGTIGFNEFCGLWGFLAAWRSLFDRFDEDKSGNISIQEFSHALTAFGYRLSPQFVQLLFRSYDRRGQEAISFDLFVQSCISLKRMTEVFKKYDDDRDGYITLSFEEFLTEILRQR